MILTLDDFSILTITLLQIAIIFAKILIILIFLKSILMQSNSISAKIAILFEEVNIRDDDVIEFLDHMLKTLD